MNEHATRQALERYLDGEVEEGESAALGEHVSSCPACARALAESARLKRAVKLGGKSEAASAQFRERIAAMAGERKQRPMMSRWLALALAGVLMVAGALGALWRPGAQASRQEISEVIDLHVSALASTNPVDVVSEDRHTVKPWFEGKVPFAFNLPEVEGSPFLLEGGRLVYVRQQPCAQLLYGLRQHRISLVVCAGGTDGERAMETPFRVLAWSQAGLRYTAVTDTEMRDLRRLQEMWVKANPQVVS